MKKAIISVGMGPGQLDFIRCLKSQGYLTAAFGKGFNSAQARTILDYSAEIDTAAADEAIAWIDSLGVEVMAVGSHAGGKAVHTVQLLSNHYHTPTQIPDKLVVDYGKTSQQAFLESFGLSKIHTWRLSELDADGVQNGKYDKYIMKPVAGRGSTGIRCISAAELSELIRSGAAASDDIVQVFQEGCEYRCVMIVQNGVLKLLAPIRRRSYCDTAFLGILSYSDEHLSELREFFDSFISEASIDSTVIKADVIVSEKEINVIEMDIGVSGGMYLGNFISELYGRNFDTEYIKLITGQNVEPFAVKEPMLRMDYVFNHSSDPVTYDLSYCEQMVSERFGKSKIYENILHPERKGGFSSNADFIFNVLHRVDVNDEYEDFSIDDYVNTQLFTHCTN